MSEPKHEQKVKDVGIDNDCICIELLNGLRLMGPMRTRPIYRDPVVLPQVLPLPVAEFAVAASAP